MARDYAFFIYGVIVGFSSLIVARLDQNVTGGLINIAMVMVMWTVVYVASRRLNSNQDTRP